MDMLKNYLKISIRSLLKNRICSIINISGLAVGLAAFLLILQYVRFERSYENFHTKADNIYRVTLDLYNGSEFIVTDCETYPLVGPLLKGTMPEVVGFVRMMGADGIHEIKVGEQNFLEEKIYSADSSVFNIFSLQMLEGDSMYALSNPFQAIITESLAKKYFGRTDVTGETFQLNNILFHITGVFADLPPNTHLKFNMLLSHVTVNKIYNWYEEDSWNGNNEYTYLLMAPGTDLNRFNRKLTDFSISMKEKLGEDRLTAEPIKKIHLYSTKSFEPEPPGNAQSVYFLLIIAIAILVIAWVNYINLSTARALERAREVGIRKIMGSGRTQLIFQFLSESFIVNFLAAGLAFTLFLLAFPYFRDITGQPLPSPISSEPNFWYQFLGILATGSLLSGSYPTLVLSSFHPVAVLKGKLRSSSHGQWLRKGLVVFQFSATAVLLISMVTVYLQINHLRSTDLGMQIDQTLVVRAPRIDSTYRSGFQAFKTGLLQRPEIQSVARSEAVPGLSLNDLSTTDNIKRIGYESQTGSYNYYHYNVDADFIPTLKMSLLAGRNFEEGKPNEDQVIINEEAVHRLGFANASEALGSKISFQTRWPGGPSTIIGVLHNYYQRSPKEAHIPMIFYYKEDASFFSLRFKTQKVKETLADVKAVWNQAFPNSVFQYFFLDQKYNQQYQADARFGEVIALFSGLAIFIACLGLLGLSSYIIVQRTKEIGIRKVLGASGLQIVRLLSQDFIKVIVIASLIAVPIAWYTMESWLSNYTVRITQSVYVFAFPVITILIVALVIVSLQTFKVAQSNPVDALRD